jgi:glycolate oxidase
MRRMNRILEIDEENMYAVVEPYAICGQIQAEAMKRGLNCHIIGAGSSTSLLASSTSLCGYGLSGISMGYNGRNVLGVEWVLPTGEILRLGSLGSGAGWFCGDGPGPSLRGIMRGFLGAAGGLGVITKAAIKLYPWPGPPAMPIEGVTPNYYSPLPENIRTYTLAFPNWDSFFDAWYKIGEAEIGYVMGKQLSAFGTSMSVPYFMSVLNPALGIDDIPELLKSPDIQETIKELKHSFQLTIAAHSPRNLQYQREALEKILDDTGGSVHPLFSDPGMEEVMHVHMIKVDRNNIIFDMAGSFGTSFGFFAVPDTSRKSLEVGEELKKRHIEKGGLLDEGGESMWGGIYEQGRIGGHLEEIFQYDPHEPKSWGGALDYILDSVLACQVGGWPLGLGIISLILPLPREIKDPVLSDERVASLFRFQRKIKQTFDPNTASDAGSYIALRETEEK